MSDDQLRDHPPRRPRHTSHVQVCHIMALAAVVVLAGCASDGSGSRPTIGATFPSDLTLAPDASSAPQPSTVNPTQPVATAAPTPAETQPTVTQPPPETRAPDTEPAKTTAAETETPTTVSASADESSAEWWPWLVGALLVVAIVAAVVFVRRRRTAPSWQIQTTTLLDEVDQLTSHLAAITPAGLHAVAQADAVRLATMRATLRNLIDSAPDTTAHTSLDVLTAPIGELHLAVDAIGMSPDAAAQPAVPSVSQLAARLHTASASVRADVALRGSAT